MLILAVTTSLTSASASIYNTETDTVIVKQCAEKRTYSETLMPTVSALLDEAKLSPNDINLVAVDIGPGSFTGVRIGVSSMNAFCRALGINIIGVSSLEALAYPYADNKNTIVSLLDCRNQNGYASMYLNGKEVLPPSAVVIDEILDTVPENAVFVGDGARIHKEAILTKIPTATLINDEQISAELLAKLAFSKYNSGICKEEVFPLYLRPSQAERLHGK